MKIYVKSDDGKVYEATQVNENNYAFNMGNKIYELALSESKKTNTYDSFSRQQKEGMTKAIFSNDEILDQLKDARKNRDKDFLYYSGDEEEFEKIIDEIANHGN